jgi:hypothetical protein
MDIINVFLKTLGIKHSKAYLRELFNTHPYKYNMYGLQLVLSHYGVKTIGVRFENKEEISLQVIFSVSSHPDNYMNKPVKLFFALKGRYGEQFMHQVLSDWYSQDEKDYEKFRLKYDIDEETIENQKDKLEWMEKWCDTMQITHTPTFFINNHLLPDDIYSYRDFLFLFI